LPAAPRIATTGAAARLAATTRPVSAGAPHTSNTASATSAGGVTALVLQVLHPRNKISSHQNETASHKESQ